MLKARRVRFAPVNPKIFATAKFFFSAQGIEEMATTGISSTAGTATGVKLTYTPLVDVSLDNNEINLVDARSFGHRVQVSIPVASVGSLFTWSRAADSKEPIPALDASGLMTALASAIVSSGFTDVDGDSAGLSFSSAALDSGLDDRLRESGSNSANDIVMAYVLYKLYGKTSVSTRDEVFNLEDAHGMLTTADFTNAILLSLVSADGAGAVKAMFRNLISSDPQRFFDASGKQIPGIFEVNADSLSNGEWQLTAGDVIEIRVRFSFGANVTRRDAAEGQLDGTNNTETISSSDKFAIRLQLKLTA